MENFNMKIVSNLDGMETKINYTSVSLGYIFTILRFLVVNCPTHNGNFKAYIWDTNLTTRLISYDNVNGLSSMVIMRGS